MRPSKTQAHCEAMLAKAKRQTAFAWKAVKDAQKESVTVEQARTEVKRIRKELRVTVKAGATAQYAAEDEAKRLRERLTHETEMFNQFKQETKQLRKELAQQNHFNQHSESKPPKKPVKHVDTSFVQQHNPGSKSYVDSQGEFYTLGGIGRRRLVGADADTAWDFLVNPFFTQPSGGQAGKIVGDMGGKRGVPNLRVPDNHDNEVINMWKNVMYHWVRTNTELGDWRQAEGRKHWEEFKKYVASGQNPNVHGDPPKGYSNLLQAYMFMVAAGYHRSQFIANGSDAVTNATEHEIFAAQAQHGYEEAIAEGSEESELTTARSKSKTKSTSRSRSKRNLDPVNYVEPGTLSGLHTHDLANTAERLGSIASSEPGQAWEIALLDFNSNDIATWLPPIIKYSADRLPQHAEHEV